MSDPIDLAKYRFELQQLETAIKTSLALNCELLHRSSETPIDSLVVQLESDTKGRSRLASLIFSPLQDTDVESLKLLQFYCETPIQVSSPQIRQTVAELLSILNLNLPIGTFCLNAEHVLTYKYVYALGKFTTIVPEEFLETFLLWLFALDPMSDLIESVVDEEQNLTSALALLQSGSL
ncbi:MAG: hypothetical protein AB8B99_23565 [Phormidesmis sp.]